MEISDTHVEWAVVNRLKDMLGNPPRTDFAVTQTFALFTTVLLWTKNRAWVGGRFPGNRDLFAPTDRNAHDARLDWRAQLICAAPWSLSRTEPAPQLRNRFDGEPTPSGGEINADFADINAEAFFEWLRNALAHGDGRSIHPLHAKSRSGARALLVGFRIAPEPPRGAPLTRTLSLYHDDMVRIGTTLAGQFCLAMSGGDPYLAQEFATAKIEEAA